MTQGLSRRNFLQGAALAGAASVAAVSVLTGCSSGTDSSEESTESAVDYASQVVETRDCDIVVVGAGASGLAASVEVLELGANVVTLEALTSPGGNASMISCVLGVDSSMQIEQGIEVCAADIVAHELQDFNYTVDGTRWLDYVHASAANIDWLIEHGVIFSGVVDDYRGVGQVTTAHWYEGEDHAAGQTSYVDPMVSEVERLAGEILTETRGMQLILDDAGAIAGIYAEGPDGVIQFNAGVVIIATGGYADNDEILASRGYDTNLLSKLAMPGHNGDGITFALAAGAKSWMEKSSMMWWVSNPITGLSDGYNTLIDCGESIYVNERGVRFMDESAKKQCNPWTGNAMLTQEITYCLYDDALLTKYEEVSSKGYNQREAAEAAIESGAMFKADTIEELAVAAGLDADALAATVDNYLAICEAGDDYDYGKSVDYLTTLDTPPYYIGQSNGHWIHTSLGGIDTTPFTEVRAEAGGIIDGLYAIGVDGCELFGGFYTIDIPGSANGNNIYTGRLSAQKACEYLSI